MLGNASMQVNRERRRCAIESMNPPPDEDETLKNSAPQLFGEGFSEKAKERDEELQCLNQASLAVLPTLHTWKWFGETSITHLYTLECEFGLQEDTSKLVTNVSYVLIMCD